MVLRACEGPGWMDKRDRAIVLLLMATPTRLVTSPMGTFVADRPAPRQP